MVNTCHIIENKTNINSLTLTHIEIASPPRAADIVPFVKTKAKLVAKVIIAEVKSNLRLIHLILLSNKKLAVDVTSTRAKLLKEIIP